MRKLKEITLHRIEVTDGELDALVGALEVDTLYDKEYHMLRVWTVGKMIQRIADVRAGETCTKTDEATLKQLEAELAGLDESDRITIVPD